MSEKNFKLINQIKKVQQTMSKLIDGYKLENLAWNQLEKKEKVLQKKS
jgi:hypothetical protein